MVFQLIEVMQLGYTHAGALVPGTDLSIPVTAPSNTTCLEGGYSTPTHSKERSARPSCYVSCGWVCVRVFLGACKISNEGDGSEMLLLPKAPIQYIHVSIIHSISVCRHSRGQKKATSLNRKVSLKQRNLWPCRTFSLVFTVNVPSHVRAS
jgi:hypothetical protein